MTDTWQPLALAGLGAFHGLNPAMGWLFAVALGLHRRQPDGVAVALVPIAARACAVGGGGRGGLLCGPASRCRRTSVRIGVGLLLIGWAALPLALRPSPPGALRHADGALAGLARVVLPDGHRARGRPDAVAGPHALVPAGTCRRRPTDGPAAVVLAGVGVHSAAMLATTAAIAVLVYEWVGLDCSAAPGSTWTLVWVAALFATGALLLVV